MRSICDGPVHTYPRGTDDPRRPGYTSAVAAAGSAATTRTHGAWRMARARRPARPLCALCTRVIAVRSQASRFSSRAAMLSHCSGPPKCLLLGQSCAARIIKRRTGARACLAICPGFRGGRDADPSQPSRPQRWDAVNRGDNRFGGGRHASFVVPPQRRRKLSLADAQLAFWVANGQSLQSAFSDEP